MTTSSITRVDRSIECAHPPGPAPSRAAAGAPVGALLLALGALLLWLFWRGRSAGRGEHGAGVTAAVTTPDPVRPPCEVVIRMARIELDGAPAELATIVERCRASSVAAVRATGGASVQSVVDVIRALQAAGVIVAAEPSLWSLLEGDRARANSRGGTHGESH